MANQYEVLGKAPTPEDLKKLSPNDVHLTIKNLNAGYGKMEILHNFELFVSKAQSLCLIGPNGAGKSTILHSIYGFTNIFSCKIEIDGKEITNLSPAEKLKSVGIAYILQDNSVFPDMTVEENLFMGGFIKDKTEESFAEAEKILQKRAFSNNKISFLWNSVVVDINGNENPKLVKSISIQSLKDNSISILDVDGIFVAIGHKPNTDLFMNKLELDNVKDININKDPRGREKPSDHTPIEIKLA